MDDAKVDQKPDVTNSSRTENGASPTLLTNVESAGKTRRASAMTKTNEHIHPLACAVQLVNATAQGEPTSCDELS